MSHSFAYWHAFMLWLGARLRIPLKPGSDDESGSCFDLPAGASKTLNLQTAVRLDCCMHQDSVARRGATPMSSLRLPYPTQVLIDCKGW